MRRILLLALLFTFVAVSVQAVPLVGGDKTYKLGSTPQVGRTYQLDDDLGGFTVKGFSETTETLQLSFFSGLTKLEDDDKAPSSTCGLSVPVDLTPSGACAYKALRADKKREYRLVVRWGYEVKKNIRVVVVRVKKTTLKLD
jgi:hypothetical protein